MTVLEFGRSWAEAKKRGQPVPFLAGLILFFFFLERHRRSEVAQPQSEHLHLQVPSTAMGEREERYRNEEWRDRLSNLSNTREARSSYTLNASHYESTQKLTWTASVYFARSALWQHQLAQHLQARISGPTAAWFAWRCGKSSLHVTTKRQRTGFCSAVEEALKRWRGLVPATAPMAKN